MNITSSCALRNSFENKKKCVKKFSIIFFHLKMSTLKFFMENVFEKNLHYKCLSIFFFLRLSTHEFFTENVFEKNWYYKCPSIFFTLKCHT